MDTAQIGGARPWYGGCFVLELMGPAIVFAVLAVAAPPVEVAEAPVVAVRQDRPFAIWIEPELAVEAVEREFSGSGYGAPGIGLLPLGIEVGRQLGSRALVSLALAAFPVANVARAQVLLGGRFYFGARSWAPYLALAGGRMTVGIDDTGGKVQTHWLAVAGPGVELALRGGFSWTTDLLLGPDIGSESTQLSARLRIGLGYRF
jgi:hypothetical protein